MTENDKNAAMGAGAAGSANVKAGAGATPSSATAGNASGPGSTRPYPDPYARGVTGAETSRIRNPGRSGAESWTDLSRARAEQIAEDARERGRRAYERGEHAYEDGVRWARDSYERGAEWVSDTYEDAARYSKRGYRQASHFIEENPLMIGVLGLATGLLIGALLPMSRREHSYFGPLRDDIRDRGYRYSREAVQRARHIAEEGYRAGYEEARRRGMTPSQMAENARDVGRASTQAASETAEKEFGENMGSGNDASSPLGPR
ncbi:hypothetical protein [Lutibaculum baratangense]|uniref:Uncharacterized protein n=1 Tax=Lutibaculum baratangense AMV1 TaxID=631454 RepID=V4R2L4_9HYPH|nr:hypothetical protein [Lutibaculum baratangense]ESR26192.1 hypothetical protein N177_1051 [Lutibaculum baratangense AMV1]